MENSCIMGFQKPDVELMASQNLQGACRSMVPPWIPGKEEDYCQCALGHQSDLGSAQVTRDISTTDRGNLKPQWNQGRSALKKTMGRSQPKPWQWSVWYSSHSEAHYPPQGHVNCTKPVSWTPFGELTGEEVENLESQGLCGGE